MIGWTPQTFWQSTPRELFAAVDGFNRHNAAGRPGEPDEADIEEHAAFVAELEAAGVAP